MKNSSFLLEPRIVSPWQIPDVVGGRFAPVRLLRVDDCDISFVSDHGAFIRHNSWWIDRKDSFPFEALEYFLPRAALRSITPELVDLIPSSSWFASLANMLTTKSWNELKAPYLAFHKGCQDCGYGERLEAHELWTYDEISQIQTLDGIVVLCRMCHDTRHLGRAKIRGKFEEVFARLCKINRIMPSEQDHYFDLIAEAWQRRSAMQWQLNINFGPDVMVELRPSIIHDGDGWLVMPATAQRPEMVTRVVNVGIGSFKGKTVLVGLHREEIEAAYDLPPV